MSEHEVLQLERDALACTGIKPEGRCRTFALLVAYGPNGAPRARLIRETLREWFDVLRDVTTEVLNDIRVAWSKAKQVIYPGHCNIKDVCGIMSNIIYILTCAGWSPRLYNCWEEPDGAVWAITDFNVAPDIVAAAISRSFFNIDLKRAAKHCRD